jgi:hypothetical protein
VVNTNSWITILTATNGSGTFSNVYALAQNNNANDRTGSVVIADQVLTIRQLGISCAVNLSPLNRNHGHGPATNTIVVNTAAGCAWEVVNTNSWIQFASATSGTGSNSLTYTITANPAVFGRSGVITINEGSVTISQDPAPCLPSIEPENETHTADAEIGNIAVTAPIGCTWTVENTNAWVTLLTGTNGSGSTNVSYQLSTNVSPLARSGNLTVAGQLYAIIQDGVVCNYRLSPTNRTHGPGTNGNTLTLNVPSPCAWFVVNTNSWITILSGSNGIGSNIISYVIAANPSTEPRTGAITVDGAVTLITQNGVVCGYSLSPSGRSHGHSATNASLSVTTPAGCAWNVVNTNSWVTITSATNGTGNGTVAYSIASNTGLVTRAGNILVADQVFAITQSPVSCNYGLSPTNRNHGFGATTNTVNITAGAGCAWNIATTNTWITFLTPTSGTGNSNVTYTISANFGSGTRVGHITLVDQVLVLNQAAPTNGFVFEVFTISPAGDLNVRLGGGPAGIWELQSSTNLTDWTKIADLTNITGRVEYHAPPPLAPMKYLRAVLP